MVEMIMAIVKGSWDRILPYITAIVGFLVGLILFGWILTPVSYTDATPQDLRVVDFQQFYLRGVAEQFASGNMDETSLRAALNIGGWGETGALIAVCQAEELARNGSLDGDVLVAAQSATSAAHLNNVAARLGGESGLGDCNAVRAAIDGGQIDDPDAAGGSRFLIGAFLVLLLLGLAATFFYLLQRRQSEDDFGDDFHIPSSRSAGLPSAPPSTLTDYDDAESAASPESGSVVPIASYRTTYEIGRDAYDDSFSIENAGSEFLGECGVGISESLGSETPKRVTALEVWLFDKNDIRTITKVVMSDHAFFDEAIKAKLAPKGEPILARPDEVVVLETATLIINARITELIYGDERQSFFERFAVELSAWAKEDSPAASMEYDFDQ